LSGRVAWRPPRSLAVRLAATYVALFLPSIALLLGALYWFGVTVPLRDMAASVGREADALVVLDRRAGRPALVRALAARLDAPAQAMPFHALVAADGRTVSANLPSWPLRPFDGWRRLEADRYSDGDEDDHEALVVERRLGDGARLIVGRDVEPIDDREETFFDSGLWLASLTILLALVGSIAMGAAIGRRLETVNRSARRVMAGDLGERIPLSGTGDDFDELAETLNAMLARMEELVESVRRVSDSVAHELRTPLARLRADLEELAAPGGGAAGRRRLAEQAVEEACRLQGVFDSLLRIARIEAGQHRSGIRAVDLTTLLADAAEYHAPGAEARGQALRAEIAPGLAVRADPDLLFQAVSNLLDNAIKYTPEGGEVMLRARAEAGAAVIAVEDSGPGIGPESRARVTERFYRAPETADRPGAGLGLSLVAAVARFHGAALVIGEAGPGASLSLRLPLADPA
jgi:signal transduction histidine kinase